MHRDRSTGQPGSGSGQRWLRAGRIVPIVLLASSLLMVRERPVQAAAGDADFMRFIHVGEYHFDPLVETPELPASLRYDGVPREDPFYHIVQFHDRVTVEMKRELEDEGAAILHYVSYNAFVVRGDAYVIDRVKALPSVRWTGLLHPAYKLSPTLAQEYDAVLNQEAEKARRGARDQQPHRIDTSLRVPIHIVPTTRSEVPDLARRVSLLGGSEIRSSSKGMGVVRSELPRPALEKLARDPEVLWVERDVATYLFNDIARWVIQSNDPVGFSTPVHDHGILGTGQTVTIADSGIDFEHDAFEDPGHGMPGPDHRKVTAYYIPENTLRPDGSPGGDETDNSINHGTHVAGTVAGDDRELGVYDGDADGSGGLNGPHDGQAFDAWIQVQDISNDDGSAVFPSENLVDLYQPAVDANSWIHTNSWGNCCSQYIDQAAQTDDFVWHNQDLVVLFAAGNAGPRSSTVNPHSVAKNAISVGATASGFDAEDLAGFTSRGPAADGRIKPDLMAPGLAVWSARGCDLKSNCTDDQYRQLSGTSMATPTAAGAAALVRQYYLDGWYSTGSPHPEDSLVPSAALVKATLINGAAEMTGSGAYANGELRYPNVNQGWGRIVLDNALFFEGDARHLVIDDNRLGLSTQETAAYSFVVARSSVPLEVTLVWSDHAGTPLTSPNLVNDLDLAVTAPDGTIYRGNQYLGFNPGQSQPDAPGVDHRNNIESVLVLPDVQPGLWRIEVHAFNVPMGLGAEQRQSYALVITGAGQALGAAWPTFHNNNERHGSSPSSFGPPLEQQWKVAADAFANARGPVLSESRVYVGSRDGFLRARDAFTGELIWQRKIGSDTYGNAVPAIENGVVYTTFLFPFPLVYALDARTGSTLWTVGEQGSAVSPALWDTTAVADGRVFIGTADDRIAALNTSDGSLEWLSASYARVWAGAAVSSGQVVIGTEDGRVIALDESSGTLNWSQVVDDGVFTVPLLAQGNVYASTRAGTVYAIDATTGEIVWQSGNYGPLFYTTPATDGSTLYFGASGTEGFVALNAASGTTVWQNFSVFPAKNSVSYADGHVYATTANGRLVALDASTGQVVNSLALDVSGGGSSPAIHNGWVWVHDHQGALYAYLGQLQDSDGDGDSDGTDCAPSDPAIHAGAAELCDGMDDNCNGLVDEGFADSDADGLADCIDSDDDGDGDPDVSDCRALDPAVSHAATEDIETAGGAPGACQDGIDNDCDGVVDLDCAVDIGDQEVKPGKVLSGSVADLTATSAQDPPTYETLEEKGKGFERRLTVVWTFQTSSSGGQGFELAVEAFRGTAGGDTFAFHYLKRATPEACDANETGWIPALTVTKSVDDDIVQKRSVGTLPDGVVCVMAQDSLRTDDGQRDLLIMDRLYLFPRPACPDYDGDGYAASCVGCANSNCPLLDCDDRSRLANPGLIEGPPGDPTCSDVIDNDCSGPADSADEVACSLTPPDAVAGGDYSTDPGTIVQGSYASTRFSDDVVEVLQEGLVGGQSRLTHIWRIDVVPLFGASYALNVEGHRQTNTEGDNFQFSFAEPLPDGKPGAFQVIPGAVIKSLFEPQGGMSYPFTPSGLSGTLFIRIEDTNPSGLIRDTVEIDRIAVETVR